MSKKSTIKLLGGIILSTTIALVGWNFKAVADMPDKYATKDETNRTDDKNTAQHQRILDKIDEVKNLILDLHAKGGD